MSETSEAAKLEARVRIIPVPIASPGHCVICGKHEHEKGFIDPRLDFEFYGTFYLCADCGGEFANVLGYISPEQAIMLAKRVQQLEHDLEIHREALLNLESAVEHLTDYRMLRNATGDGNSSVDLSGSTNETPTLIDETISGTVVEFPTRTTDDESSVSEPVIEQGSNDVPSVTSDDDHSSITIIDL